MTSDLSSVVPTDEQGGVFSGRDCRSAEDVPIDWARLVPHILRNRTLGDSSIHGPAHWARVCRNGLLCAEGTDADLNLIRLFALLHDHRRENDHWDRLHGERASEAIQELQGMYFDLSPERLFCLQKACAGHAHGGTHDDPTIAACWDGDRLDLLRIRRAPSPRYMSTATGRRICMGERWSDLDDAALIPVSSWGEWS